MESDIEHKTAFLLYFICRDYLGSLTHITDASGNVIEENSYDAWGRLRNPANYNEVYSAENQPTLLLGRGYTGHEHMPQFGLINMNARLYDPAVGRFLSPDPYVPNVTNSQDFNRYSYARNNPMVYTDPDGEWIHLVIGAVFGGVINVAMNADKINNTGQFFKYFGIGAAAGAIGAGVGTGIMTASSGASFWAGFVGSPQGISTILGAGYTSSFINGAASGAGAGFSSGFTLGFGNGLAGGQSFGESLGQGAYQGLIGGATSGLLGGLAGGFSALSDGRRFLDGATVERTILAQQDIPIVGQIGDYNCLPASAEAIDRSFHGTMTQQDIRNLPGLGGDPRTTPLIDGDVWAAYADASGACGWDFYHPSDGNKFSNILSNMQRGDRVAINLKTADGGHSVVMQNITQKTITKANGTVVQKIIYNVMNPANGGSYHSISTRSINRAYNIFFVF